MRKLFILPLLFVMLYAQKDTNTTLNPSTMERFIQPKITFQTDYLSDAGFEGFDASVQTTKTKLSLNNAIGGISYSHWNFQWKNPNTLPFYKGKTPIKSMQRLKLYANIPYFINDKWFMLSGISLNATYEEEYEESFGGSVFSFFSYKFNEEHAFQMGAFANYHAVKTLALPVVGYTYRIRQTDGFSLALGFPRAYLGYNINPKLLLNAGMIFSQAVIRLADDSGIENRGYVEAKDYESNIGFRYTWKKHLEISADVLYTLKRDFTIYNNSANELSSYSIKPSFGAIIKLRYRI